MYTSVYTSLSSRSPWGVNEESPSPLANSCSLRAVWLASRLFGSGEEKWSAMHFHLASTSHPPRGSPPATWPTFSNGDSSSQFSSHFSSHFLSHFSSPLSRKREVNNRCSRMDCRNRLDNTAIGLLSREPINQASWPQLPGAVAPARTLATCRASCQATCRAIWRSNSQATCRYSIPIFVWKLHRKKLCVICWRSSRRQFLGQF